MNKNFLIILSVFVIVIFLTGCSPQVATPTTQTNTNTAVDTSSNTASNPTTIPTSGTVIAPASDNVKEIDIEASSFDFVQTGPQINKGDKVRITFTVTSGMHSLLMPGYNVEFTRMGPGQTQSTTFIADKSGTFEYHCNNPCGSGHADMVGQLVVN